MDVGAVDPMVLLAEVDRVESAVMDALLRL
jgi:hypothetical protein